MLAAVLLCLALIEALFSDEQPTPVARPAARSGRPARRGRLLRTWPEGAAGAVVGVFVLAVPRAVPVREPSGAGLRLAGDRVRSGGVVASAVAVAGGAAARRDDARPAHRRLRGHRTWSSTGRSSASPSAGSHRAPPYGPVRPLASRLRHAEVEREARTEEAVARERALVGPGAARHRGARGQPDGGAGRHRRDPSRSGSTPSWPTCSRRSSTPDVRPSPSSGACCTSSGPRTSPTCTPCPTSAGWTPSSTASAVRGSTSSSLSPSPLTSPPGSRCAPTARSRRG